MQPRGATAADPDREARRFVRNNPLASLHRFISRHVPPVTGWIIIANVFVFLFQYLILVPFNAIDRSIFLFSQIPYMAVQKMQVWRFVTYMFLHGSGTHLIFNMLALFFFGRGLESFWGWRRFLRFYLICGIGAALLHALAVYVFGGKTVLPTGESIRGLQIMIGASGAIYGILLAYAMLWPNTIVYLNFIIPMKIKYLVIIYGVISFVGSVGDSGGGISHVTHLGGLLTAFLYFLVVGFKGGSAGGFSRRRTTVKRYYRDSDGRIYVQYDEE